MKFCDIGHHYTNEGPERAWTKSTWLWESGGISLRSCRIQPQILNTDSSALECISLSDSPSRSFSCRSHSLAKISWRPACISRWFPLPFWSRNCHSGHVPYITDAIQECINILTYLWCFVFFS